jgi:hypothetical protein
MSKVSEARKNAYMPVMFDDIDVSVTSNGLVSFHFPPNDINPDGSDVVQLELVFKAADDKELTKSYRIGDAKYIKITNDGASFEFTPEAKGMRKDSDFNLLCDKLDAAGYPTIELDEDRKGLKDGLTGVVMHIKSEPVKDAKGETKRHTDKKTGREYDTTQIWPEKIVKLPWDAKGGKKAAPATAKKGTAAAASSGANGAVSEDDVKTKLSDMILNMVADATDNIVAKSAVVAALVKAFEGDARKIAVNLAKDAGFLESIAGVTFDGSNLTLG